MEKRQIEEKGIEIDTREVGEPQPPPSLTVTIANPTGHSPRRLLEEQELLLELNKKKLEVLRVQTMVAEEQRKLAAATAAPAVIFAPETPPVTFNEAVSRK